MIISYGGKNCWLFKDWFEINFQINKNVPAEFGFQDKRVVPIMCFEGPNASGKTCALKILTFIADFCKNSFSYAPEREVPYDTFFHNRDESEFNMTFSLSSDIETEYTYEVVFLDKKVKREKLTSRRKRTKTTLISRFDDGFKEINIPGVGNAKIQIRDNVSCISTLYQYGVKAIYPFIEFFGSIISNISYIGRMDDHLLSDPASFYYKNPEMLEKVKVEMKKMDTGISNIKIEDFTNQEGKKVYYSVIYNETEQGEKPLNYFAMSTGSKLLYSLLNDILSTIEKGGVLVFDELDYHLHSSLVPMILKYFLDPEINTKHSQLVFTSHDSSLLDIAKKYRTYIFEKDKGEGICYRIDELPANMTSRNDRSLEQVYKSGILGGLPNA